MTKKVQSHPSALVPAKETLGKQRLPKAVAKNYEERKLYSDIDLLANDLMDRIKERKDSRMDKPNRRYVPFLLNADCKRYS